MKAEYRYKCRLCKKVHTQQIGGWGDDIIGSEMFIVTHGDSPAFQEAKVHRIEAVSYHLCKDGSMGVCDFIGVRKVKE